MEPGFLPDTTYGGVVPPKWAAGEPTRNWLNVVSLKGKTTYPVVTYRCEKCGYLEAYATG